MYIIYLYKTKDEMRRLYQRTLQFQQFWVQNEVESSGLISICIEYRTARRPW